MKKGIKTSQCDELGCFFSDWEIIRKFGFKLISSEKEFSTILGEYCVSTFSNENVYLKVRYYPKKGSLNEVVGLSVVNLKAEKVKKNFFYSKVMLRQIEEKTTHQSTRTKKLTICGLD